MKNSTRTFSIALLLASLNTTHANAFSRADRMNRDEVATVRKNPFENRQKLGRVPARAPSKQGVFFSDRPKSLAIGDDGKKDGIAGASPQEGEV